MYYYCDNFLSMWHHYMYVIGFAKTLHVCTKLKSILLLIIIATLKHCPDASDKIARDKQVCFYRQLFANPVKLWKTKTDPVGWGHWGTLIKWLVVPSCSTECLLSLWYGQGYCRNLSGLLSTQLGQLCLLGVLTTHPPLIHCTYDIAGCVQNISQNQPVQPVAMYIC